MKMGDTMHDRDQMKETVDETRLNQGFQANIADLVKSLDAPEPNLAWRAALSERINAEAARCRKRRRAFFAVKSSLAFACAAGLACFIFVRTGSRTAPAPIAQLSPSASSSLEATLVQAHEEADTASDVVGSGLNENRTPMDSDASYWGPDDADSL